MSLATLDQHIEQGTMIRHKWTDIDAQGRKLACLLAALSPEVAKSENPAYCPSSIMPQWLAFLTPWIAATTPAHSRPDLMPLCNTPKPSNPLRVAPPDGAGFPTTRGRDGYDKEHRMAKTRKSVARKRSKSGRKGSFWVPGRAYFIRTVTHYIVGRLVRMEGAVAILTEAAWVADTGRFNEAMSRGTLLEVEPWPASALVAVNTTAMIDASEWSQSLPLGVK